MDFKIHSICSLPSQWPSEPPKVFISTPLPHPNVLATTSSSSEYPFEVCLHILEDGWSSAITLERLFFYIGSCLMNKSYCTHFQKCSLSDAEREARAFRCSICEESDDTICVLKEEEKIQATEKHFKLTPLTYNRYDLSHEDTKRSSQNIFNELLLEEKEEEEEEDDDEKSSTSFSILNPYMFAIFATRILEAKEIRNLSTCCKHLNTLTSQSVVWSTLIKRDLGIVLKNTTKSETKRAYHLARNHVFSNLKCYHTLISFEDDDDDDGEIFGIPIDFTIHPVKKTVDHIVAPMDGVLSYTAFNSYAHRMSASGVSTRGWIPLFLTQKHFDRALRRGIFQNSILKLSPGETQFRPELAVNALVKLCNTIVLLLSDDGIRSCERTLQGYVHIWRLFVAVCKRYPGTKRKIRQRLQRFVRDPSARLKSQEPSLGHLLPLLAVCSEVKWKGAFSRAFMNESFDRGVLWIGRDHPELIMNVSRLKIGTGPDYDRLKKSFESRRVAMKLAAVHVTLSSVMKSPSIERVARCVDWALGQSPRFILYSLTRSLDGILNQTNLSWPKMITALKMERVPSPSQLTDMLKRSVRNSERKRYHNRKTTDFTRIHRGGVSRILLQGDTMVLPAARSAIQIVDTWRWHHGVPTKYFDSTVLFYDFQGNHVETLDYQHTHIFRGGATHSGDMITHSELMGKHVVNIELSRLDGVKTLYIVLSSFQNSTLSEICFPEVSLYDRKTNTRLCEYQEKSKNLDKYSSVIMCRVFRNSLTSPWRVEALGRLGQGDALDYSPILESIDTTT